MKTIRILTVLAIAFISSACAAFTGEPGSYSELPVMSGQKASSSIQFRELEDWLSSNRLSITAGAGENDYNRAFAQGSVIAFGEGLPSSSSFNSAQRRLTAERAAEVVAQRNLADFFASKERFGEIRFISFTVRLEAFLKGATTVATEYDAASGRAAALVKLDLRGARGFAP